MLSKTALLDTARPALSVAEQMKTHLLYYCVSEGIEDNETRGIDTIFSIKNFLNLFKIKETDEKVFSDIFQHHRRSSNI